MSKITYNSQYIRPIEAISIAHNPIFNEEGIPLSNLYTINMRGKLLVNRGSPTSSGTFGYFGSNDCENIPETGVSSTTWIESLLTKRCALSDLFNDHYKELKIGTVAGTADLTCYPRVTSFNVEESDNPQYWPFSVTFEADNLFCSGVPLDATGSPRIRSASESWEFNYDDERVFAESGDNRIYNVGHTVSAQGLRTYGASGQILYSGIDAARQYVQGRVGLLAVAPLTAISGFDSYTTKYNYVDSHSIDLASSTYSVNETWVYCSGPYIEEYTIEKTTSNNRSCPTVSINGNIQGLGIRSLASGDITTSKYTNALNHWNAIGTSGLKSRAESVSGSTLYNEPISTSVSYAPLAGTISYNYEFNGGPTKRLSSAIYESFSLSQNFGEDIYANPAILDAGEIIQLANGSGYGRLNSTTLNIEAVYPCSTGTHAFGPRFTPSLSGELQTAINNFNPYLTISGVGYQAIDSQSENWNINDSSYSYSITWKWQTSGVCSV